MKQPCVPRVPSIKIFMAFRFNWPQFDADFYAAATQSVELALNKGQKPPHICDDIQVKELHLGTKVIEASRLDLIPT